MKPIFTSLTSLNSIEPISHAADILIKYTRYLLCTFYECIIEFHSFYIRKNRMRIGCDAFSAFRNASRQICCVYVKADIQVLVAMINAFIILKHRLDLWFCWCEMKCHHTFTLVYLADLFEMNGEWQILVALYLRAPRLMCAGSILGMLRDVLCDANLYCALRLTFRFRSWRRVCSTRWDRTLIDYYSASKKVAWNLYSFMVNIHEFNEIVEIVVPLMTN